MKKILLNYIYLEQRKYRLEKKKPVDFIDAELNDSSDDDNDDDDDSTHF